MSAEEKSEADLQYQVYLTERSALVQLKETSHNLDKSLLT